MLNQLKEKEDLDAKKKEESERRKNEHERKRKQKGVDDEMRKNKRLKEKEEREAKKKKEELKNERKQKRIEERDRKQKEKEERIKRRSYTEEQIMIASLYVCDACKGKGCPADEENGILWFGCDEETCGLWFHHEACLTQQAKEYLWESMEMDEVWYCHSCKPWLYEE